MPQSDGRNKLKRMEIEFKDFTFKFNVNPEEYMLEIPSRSMITQAKQGAWIDDFGQGLPVLTCAGHTGFKTGGFLKYKELRKLVKNYYGSVKYGEKIRDDMIFHNFTDEESWVVHPDPSGFKFMRSVKNPLLFRYEMKLVCVRPAEYPGPVSQATATGGVMRTLGTPIPLATTYSGQPLQDVPKSFIKSELGMEAFPPASLVSFVGTLDTIRDGRLSNFREYASVFNPQEDDRVQAVSVSFDPVVSNLSAKALTKIRRGEMGVRRGNADENTTARFAMEINKKNVSDRLVTAFKAILLELLSMYMALDQNTDELKRNMSKDDLKRISNNIRWLSEEIFKQSSIDRELVNKLRLLERSVKYIENSELYNDKLRISMESINRAREV